MSDDRLALDFLNAPVEKKVSDEPALNFLRGTTAPPAPAAVSPVPTSLSEAARQPEPVAPPPPQASLDGQELIEFTPPPAPPVAVASPAEPAALPPVAATPTPTEPPADLSGLVQPDFGPQPALPVAPPAEEVAGKGAGGGGGAGWGGEDKAAVQPIAPPERTGVLGVIDKGTELAAKGLAEAAAPAAEAVGAVHGFTPELSAEDKEKSKTAVGNALLTFGRGWISGRTFGLYQPPELTEDQKKVGGDWAQTIGSLVGMGGAIKSVASSVGGVFQGLDIAPTGIKGAGNLIKIVGEAGITGFFYDILNRVGTIAGSDMAGKPTPEFGGGMIAQGLEYGAAQLGQPEVAKAIHEGAAKLGPAGMALDFMAFALGGTVAARLLGATIERVEAVRAQARAQKVATSDFNWKTDNIDEAISVLQQAQDRTARTVGKGSIPPEEASAIEAARNQAIEKNPAFRNAALYMRMGDEFKDANGNLLPADQIEAKLAQGQAQVEAEKQAIMARQAEKGPAAEKEAAAPPPPGQPIFVTEGEGDIAPTSTQVLADLRAKATATPDNAWVMRGQAADMPRDAEALQLMQKNLAEVRQDDQGNVWMRAAGEYPEPTTAAPTPAPETPGPVTPTLADVAATKPQVMGNTGSEVTERGSVKPEAVVPETSKIVPAEARTVPAAGESVPETGRVLPDQPMGATGTMGAETAKPSPAPAVEATPAVPAPEPNWQDNPSVQHFQAQGFEFVQAKTPEEIADLQTQGFEKSGVAPDLWFKRPAPVETPAQPIDQAEIAPQTALDEVAPQVQAPVEDAGAEEPLVQENKPETSPVSTPLPAYQLKVGDVVIEKPGMTAPTFPGKVEITAIRGDRIKVTGDDRWFDEKAFSLPEAQATPTPLPSAFTGTPPQTRDKKITEHEDITGQTKINAVTYSKFAEIVKAQDWPKVQEELTLSSANFTVDAFDHHFNPLSVMARLEEGGLTHQEAKALVKNYEAQAFKPVREVLAARRAAEGTSAAASKAGGAEGVIIPPSWEVADKYQWMANKEGGQTQGNRMILVRVSPEIYEQFVRDKLKGNPPLDVAKKKGWISSTEAVQLIDKGNGWEVTKVGKLSDLRPTGEATKWAKKVDDFTSPEAVKHGKIFDSSVTPVQVATPEVSKPLSSAITGKKAGPVAGAKPVVPRGAGLHPGIVGKPKAAAPEAPTFKAGDRVSFRNAGKDLTGTLDNAPDKDGLVDINVDVAGVKGRPPIGQLLMGFKVENLTMMEAAPAEAKPVYPKPTGAPGRKVGANAPKAAEAIDKSGKGGVDPGGLTTRLVNGINDIPRELTRVQGKLDDAKAELQRITRQLKMPFEHAKTLRDSMAEIIRINQELAAEDPAHTPVSPDMASAMVDGWDMERTATQRTGPTIATAMRRPLVAGARYRLGGTSGVESKTDRGTRGLHSAFTGKKEIPNAEVRSQAADVAAAQPGNRSDNLPPAGTGTQRDLEDFKLRRRQEWFRPGKKEFAKLEYSETLAASPEFQEVARDALAQGIKKVIPVKNAYFDGAIYPEKDGDVMLLNEELSESATHRQIVKHEGTHHLALLGDPVILSLIKAVDTKSDAFKAYREVLNAGYREAGMSRLSDRAMAEEVVADYRAGLTRVDLNGQEIHLGEAFQGPDSLKHILAAHDFAHPAGGMEQAKTSKFAFRDKLQSSRMSVKDEGKEPGYVQGSSANDQHKGTERSTASPEIRERGRRELANFKSRESETATRDGSTDAWKEVEFSEKLANSPDFQDFLQRAKNHGIDLVIPIKSPTVNGYLHQVGNEVHLLLNENPTPRSIEQVFTHEVFHYDAQKGNPDARAILQLIDYNSEAFKSYRKAIDIAYERAGFPLLESYVVAEELGAEFVANRLQDDKLLDAFKDKGNARDLRSTYLYKSGLKGGRSYKQGPLGERYRLKQPKVPITPKENKGIDKWLGEREISNFDSTVIAGNRQRAIMAALGKKKFDAEAKAVDNAMTHYIELKSFPEHVANYYQDLKPEDQKAVDLAQHTIPNNPKLKAIADEIAVAYEVQGDLALNAEVVHELRDNYAAHIWNLDKGPSVEAQRKFATKTGHAQQRTFDTEIQGLAAGYEPLVRGATNKAMIYSQDVGHTIADRQFIKGEMGKTLSTKQSDERPTQIQHPNMRGWKWAGSIEVEPIIAAVQRMSEEIKNSTKTSSTTTGPGTAGGATEIGPIKAMKEVVRTSLVIRGMTEDEANAYINRIETAAVKASTGEKATPGQAPPEKTTTVIQELRETIVKIEKSQEVVGHTVKPIGRKDLFVNAKGDIFQKVPLFASEGAAGKLNNILGTSALKSIRPLNTAINISNKLKELILFLSGYHHQAGMRGWLLGVTGQFKQHGLKALSPRQTYRQGLDLINEMDPVIRHGVQTGGLVLGMTPEWRESLNHDKGKIGGLLDKWKVTKAVRGKVFALWDQQVNFLFGKLFPGLQSMAYVTELKNFQKKFPGTDKDDAAKKVAELCNYNFGNLNYPRLGGVLLGGKQGRNPTVQHLLRAVFLAPQWTESNYGPVRELVGALLKGDKETAYVYRKFWASVFAKGIALLLLGNLAMSMFDDKSAWESFKERWSAGRLKFLGLNMTPVYRGAWKAMGLEPSKSQKVFSPMGHFLDAIKMFSHPLLFLHHKASPLYRVFHEAMAGVNWKGQAYTTAGEIAGTTAGGALKGKIVKEGKGGVIGWSQMPSFILGQLRGSMPIPAGNLMGMLLGEMDGFDALTKSSGTMVSSFTPKTEAQGIISDYYRAALPNRNLTPEEQDRKKLEKELLKQARSGDMEGFTDALKDAVADGKLSTTAAKNLMKEAQHPEGVASFAKLPLEVALKAFEAASDQEKELWGPALIEKVARSQTETLMHNQASLQDVFRGLGMDDFADTLDELKIGDFTPGPLVGPDEYRGLSSLDMGGVDSYLASKITGQAKKARGPVKAAPKITHPSKTGPTQKERLRRLGLG